jgi:cellulose synthase/poly-beta-1,6-N-acetylglucosamine synthase-like glycosyltransferase
MLDILSDLSINGILYYFIALNLCYFLLSLHAFRDIRRSYLEWRYGKISTLMHHSSILPKITVLIPAHNEQQRIVETIHGVLKSNYANLELVIINDGSTDETMLRLLTTFDLVSEPAQSFNAYAQKFATKPIIHTYRSRQFAHILVLNKIKGGKADALNAGLNYTNTELFLTIDADTCIDHSAIDWLAFTLLIDNKGIAAGGVLYATDEEHSHNAQTTQQSLVRWKPLLGVQSIEYVRSFLFGRTSWNAYNGPLILSGALSLFLTSAVMKVKGFNTRAPSEDMDIVVNLHQYHLAHRIPYQISHVPSANGWTIVPDTMRKLWQQRSRWHLGLFDSLMNNKKMLFNYRYSRIGFLSYPFQLFGEFLGPLIEFIGYFILIMLFMVGEVNLTYTLLFFFLSLGTTSIYTTMAMKCHILTFNKQQKSQNVFSTLFYIILENAGYRQFMALCHTLAIFRGVGSRLRNRNRNRDDTSKYNPKVFTQPTLESPSYSMETSTFLVDHSQT